LFGSQEKNLALREVAAAAGMDQAHLSKAELGQRLPTEEQVKALAVLLQNQTRGHGGAASGGEAPS
jgi:transcriptional regulator with XRE-family HTH domain